MKIVECHCPTCASPQKKLLRSNLSDVEAKTPGQYGIVQCLHCHFIYLSPRPTEESLPDCYPNTYYTQLATRCSPFSQTLYQPRYQFRQRRIEKVYQGIPASLLEIGYGDGAFLAYLKSKWGSRCQLAGIDFKPPSHQQHLTGIDLMEGDFLKFHFKNSYEMIVMYSVLEHLPQPVEALRRLSQLLKPNGLLVMEVPNWNSLWRLVFAKHWSGLQIPRHQSFFNRRILQTVLEQTGYQMKRCKQIFDPGDLSVSFCNWFSDLLKFRTPPRQAWFFLPATILCSPLVFLQCALLRNSGEMECIAVKQ